MSEKIATAGQENKDTGAELNVKGSFIWKDVLATSDMKHHIFEIVLLCVGGI